MTAQDIANSLIYRAQNCRVFYVHRSVEDGILFDGAVPFDLTVVDGQAEFGVLALTQDEAELQVDQWLIPRT